MGFLNSLFGNIQKAFQGAGQSIGGALGNVGSTAMNLATKAGQGAGQNIFQSFMPQTSGPAAKSALPQAMSQGKSIAPAVASAMSGFNSTSPAQTSSSIANIFNKFKPGYQAPGGNAGNAAPNNYYLDQNQGGKDIMSQLFGGKGNELLGAGVGMLGDALAPKAKIPDANSSSSYQALQNFQPGKMSPEMEASINRSLKIKQDNEIKLLTDHYRNLRPGSDLTTDSAYQRDLANLQRQQGLDTADALASAGTQVSSQELTKLQEMASLDHQTIMAQTGMDMNEADEFKQKFGTLGSIIAGQGSGDSTDISNENLEANNQGSTNDLFKMFEQMLTGR